MAQVEVHGLTERGADGPSFLLLVPERLRQAVAGAELHRLWARPRVERAEAVVLEVTVAVLVGENSALSAAAFRDEHPGAGECRRMPLDELHVAQGHAVAVGDAHAVAGDDAGVGVLTEYASRAPGADDRCLAFDQQEFPGRDIGCDYALHPAVLDDQVGAEKLVVALDGGVLVRGLEQRVQHVEAGLVRREPRALDLHAAEEADVDVAVVLAAPRTAPVLEL